MTQRRGRRGRSQASSQREVSVSEKSGARQLLEMAVGLHQKGEVGRAVGLYEQIIEQEPHHADALHFLGLARFQLGDLEPAASLIRRAIDEKPSTAAYHDNLGTVLEAQGHLNAALSAYDSAVSLAGEDGDRLFNRGVVLDKLGRRDEAEAAYRRAIELKPDDAAFHYNLGIVLKAAGRLDEAVESFRRATRHGPAASHAWNNLGNTLQALGRGDEALEAYRSALDHPSGDPLLYLNYGNALREREEPEEAVRVYEQALARGLDSVELFLALGSVRQVLGRLDVALEAYVKALEREPDNREARIGLASLTGTVQPSTYQPDLVACIELCLQAPEVRTQDLVVTAANQLRRRYALDSRIGEPDALIERLAGDRLAHELLKRTLNVDPKLEEILVAVRRRLLELGVSGGATLPVELAAALAAQCFRNEYVFTCSAEEEGVLEAMRERFEARVAKDLVPDESLQLGFTLLCMYVAPCSLACAATLAAIDRDSWHPLIRPLVESTLLEPLEERSLASEIASICEVEDETSLAVREQYEESPYPRWMGVPQRSPVDYREYLEDRFPHVTVPAIFDGDVEVLVAGCGTGQAVTLAAARRPAKVVGLDLSRRSLAYGLRMVRKLGIDNVEFVHGDILQARRLERQFHVVECTGVLHHMARPEEGWAALTDCLVPGGFMRVGLYSELARQEVVVARQRIEEMGLGSELQDIRAFRQRVLAAKPGDPLLRLVDSEDLYSASMCRDLLFHVHEVRFTMPRMAAALDDLGLVFVGFELRHPWIAHAYRSSNPEDATMTDLNAWERFEADHRDTFAAMYLFWCQKRNS